MPTRNHPHASVLHPHHELCKTDSKASDLSNVTIEIRGSHKDVQISDDSLEIKGNLKVKKIEESVDWEIPIYDDIIIEKIYGQGRLFFQDITNIHSKNHQLLYDSNSQDKLLSSNTKYIRLHSGHSYHFKLAKYEELDEIVVQYRNKYSLDL